MYHVVSQIIVLRDKSQVDNADLASKKRVEDRLAGSTRVVQAVLRFFATQSRERAPRGENRCLRFARSSLRFVVTNITINSLAQHITRKIP